MHVPSSTQVRSRDESKIPERLVSDQLRAPSDPSSGISCSIILLEPFVYLPGPDNRGYFDDESNTEGVIRGVLRLEVTRSIKIKTVKLSLWGRARIANSAGQPFIRSEGCREEDLRYHVLPFFNANEPSSGDEFGIQCDYTLQDTTLCSTPNTLVIHDDRHSQDTNPSQSREHFTKVSQCPDYASSQTQSSCSLIETQETTSRQNTYKIFHPGIYQYHFEIMLDYSYPETIKLPLGMVRWELQAAIERAGVLRRNIHIHKEVSIIRVPFQSSWDLSLPMAMTRLLNSKMDCRIVILGRTFAVGSRIPVLVTTKLLEEIRCHSISAYLLEQVGYFNDRIKETKFGGRRHILLYKYQSKKLRTGSNEMSDNSLFCEDEPLLDVRSSLRSIRSAPKVHISTREVFSSLPQGGFDASMTENVISNLGLFKNQNEFELDIHIPTCSQMRVQREKLIHPSTKCELMQVRHWIKIKIGFITDNGDSRGPGFADVEIDVAVDILSCLAGTKYTSLPAYSHREIPGPSFPYDCGCPDAAPKSNF